MKPNDKPLAWLLSIGGSLGLLASMVISLDKLKLLSNPGFVPSCNINPIISCGTIMESAQAAAFGLPNSFLGLIGFTAVIVVGVSLLAGSKFPSWYWRLFNLGTLFGVGFVHWLFFQSVYRIQALCPWCMLVWTVTIPIFWYTTIRNFRLNVIPLPKSTKAGFDFADSYKNVILLLWYLIIAGLILAHFWYYFRTVI